MIIICNSFRFIPDDGEVTILLIITYPIYKGQQYFILWKLVREGVTGAHIRSREGQISNTLSATPFSINTPLFFCFWQKLLLCPHFCHIYSDIYRTVWKSSELRRGPGGKQEYGRKSDMVIKDCRQLWSESVIKQGYGGQKGLE